MTDVNFEIRGSTLVINILGEVDHHGAFAIKDRIDSHILKYRPQKAVMNFKKVTFMDSSGIGLVLSRYNFCKNCGTRLCVQGMNVQAQRILALAGIDTVSDIFNQEI